MTPATALILYTDYLYGAVAALLILGWIGGTTLSSSSRPPDTRPCRQMYAPGPEMSTTAEGYRQTWRQVGWLGQTGAIYSLDENPLGDGYERGGVAPLYFIAHAERLDSEEAPA